MCESNAYIVDSDGREQLLMENVDYLRPKGDELLLRNLFGEEKIVRANIKEMDLTAQRIMLEYV
jgi:predicted RNA-binding protein